MNLLPGFPSEFFRESQWRQRRGPLGLKGAYHIFVDDVLREDREVFHRVHGKLLKTPFPFYVSDKQLMRFDRNNTVHRFQPGDVPQGQRIQRRIPRAHHKARLAGSHETLAKGVFDEGSQESK